MKKFLFLYPIEEYFEFDIGHGAAGWIWDKVLEEVGVPDRHASVEEFEARQKLMAQKHQELEEEARREYREVHSARLCECIDIRYRQQGFAIYYAVFNDRPVHPVIRLHPADTVFQVGLDFKVHTAKRPDSTYPYPDTGFIVDRLGEVDVLRVAGYHLWDCVEKVAVEAHARGIDTLIDEDLTELFFFRHRQDGFRTDHYPTFNPRADMRDYMFEAFMERRKGRPWLWQDF